LWQGLGDTTADLEGYPMNVAVVVPRRAHGWRDLLWRYAKPHWEAAGYPILEVEHTEGLFNRSWCLNEGARLAGDWDVLILADADVIVEAAQVHAAAGLAMVTGSYTVAGDERYGLTQRPTELLLQGWRFEKWRDFRMEQCKEHRWECGMTTHNFNSHAVAIRRDLWETVGGFDERFEGWGHEDGAFLAACETFGANIERVAGPLIHLFHERAPERSRIHPHWGKNRDLRARYTEAKGDPDAMRALLDERMVTA
jgi:hypothetical protein